MISPSSSQEPICGLITQVFLPIQPMPARADVVTVMPDDERPAVVLALLAKGEETAKQALGQAGEAIGLPQVRAQDDKGEDEVLLAVVATASPEAFWQLANAAKAGKYGQLDVEIVITPREALSEGEEYLDQARVYSLAQVRQPR